MEFISQPLFLAILLSLSQQTVSLTES